MKIILNADVPQLGDEGDIKVVKDGYARNYLFPKNLAMPFSKHGLVILEQKKAKIVAKKEQKKQEALSLKQKLDGLKLTLVRSAGQNGKLFGAVTNAVIATELQEMGLNVERKQIGVPQNALKVVGEYDVKVKLLEKEVAYIHVSVKSTAEEEQKANDEKKKEDAAKQKAEKAESAVSQEETEVVESTESEVETEDSSDEVEDSDTEE